MNGTIHAAIGAAAGFFVADFFHSSPSATLFLVGFGGVSALMPDMDIDGKLRKKITFSHKLIRTFVQIIGIIVMLYSLYTGIGADKYAGIIIGFGILIISFSIKQKHMLLLSGIGVLIGAIALKELWMILLGVFIIFAVFTRHRGYTHSLAGLLFFSLIAHQLELSLGAEGVFYTGCIAYASHLAADMKLVPFNKRGVPLFLPISSKEI